MVLWISAALAAVAFSLANTVRGETDRTSTEIDEIRGYYLASGAVDRAAVELLWSVTFGGERKIKQGAAWVDYTFPEGVAHVELIPETAKLDVNFIPPERLMRLVMALGVEAGQASEITRAIVARRTPGGGAGGGPGAAFSLAPGSSFPAAGASFQEIEELLSVRGITPELFYGTYVPAQGDPGPDQPRLIRRSGLVECLSVFGSKGQVDANTADPAVLTALGLTPDVVQFLLRLRRAAPLTQAGLNQLAPMLGPAAQFLRLEGNSIITMRATARVRLANGQLSDMKRTVAAQVKYMPPNYTPPIHILRWYDTTWSN
jgi:general secretion pathway protein K